MALLAQFNMTYSDSAGRESTVSPYVKETDAQAFVAAADETARDATALGLLEAGFTALSEMTLKKRWVSYGDTFATNDPASNAGIYRGNKLVVKYDGSGRGRHLSIPGRKDSVLTLSGTNANITIGDLATLVTRLENTATDINGNPINVTEAVVND